MRKRPHFNPKNATLHPFFEVKFNTLHRQTVENVRIAFFCAAIFAKQNQMNHFNLYVMELHFHTHRKNALNDKIRIALLVLFAVTLEHSQFIATFRNFIWNTIGF
jgi:hypothetical protein